MKIKNEKITDTSTESKIKEAARAVFYRKGYAATRTRDIAEEAGINLALLNYYFRSKEKLFELIMMETLTGFMHNILIVVNDEHTSLEAKVSELASRYIDMIIQEPAIPTFIVTEIQRNPDMLLQRIPVKQTLLHSVFLQQHQLAVREGKIKEPNPIHFVMNLLGLIIFPFIAKPLIMRSNDIETEQFNKLMQDRKKQIPIWIKAMMKAK